MYGVSRITSEQDIMLITFPAAQYDTVQLADYLDSFAKSGVNVDMICQNPPRGSVVDFSLTASYSYFGQVMQTLAARPKQAGAPLISSGYTKISLFGEEMVTSCGVAARAMGAVAKAGIEVVLITTSLLDISLLVRQVDEDQALQVLQETFAL